MNRDIPQEHMRDMALRAGRPTATRHRDPLLLGAMLVVIAVAASGWLTALSQLRPLTSGDPIRNSAPQASRLAAAFPSPTATMVEITPTEQVEDPTPTPPPPTVPPTPSIPPTDAPAAAATSTPTPLATISAPPTPSATVPAPRPTLTDNPSTASGVTHVVQAGETVWSISSRYGVRHELVLAANGLGPDAAIRVGQRLIIPGATGDQSR